MTNPRRRSLRSLPFAFAAGVALAACTAAGGPAASGMPSPAPASASAPAPSANDLPTSAPGGGGSSGSVGSGIVDPAPVDPAPVDPNGPGGNGQAALVIPRPGQKDLRPVAPTKLETSVDGRHVLVKISWYSGVEPCNVLDSVKVERSGNEIAVTPMEGTGDGDAMCIEIAMLKATIVDLGDVEPGTWTIVAPTGDAAPVEITIT